MTPEEFRTRVETAAETELERLGSSKLLVALTGADLTEEHVLQVAADSEHAAADVFAAWAADAATADLADAYATAADEERGHRDRVLDELADYEPSGTGAVHDHLASLADPVPRLAAGFVGRGLVAERTHTQVVSFFVNQPNERLADLFRDLRAETRQQADRGASLLEDYCSADADWDRAERAAVDVVGVAYDEYAGDLEGMGVNPKSVC